MSGTKVYFRPEYLRMLALNAFDNKPSGLLEYQYVRPASRQEIKSGEVADHPKEIVGEDGNIYVSLPAPSSAHFFIANAAFKGKYDPYWEDPDLVIPVGLEPIDVAPISDQAMRVLSVRPNHVLLETAEGKQIVFFRGYPPIEAVFFSEKAWKQLQQKQEYAAALTGRSFWISENGEQAFRSPSRDAVRMGMPKDAREILVSGSRSSAEGVALALGADGRDSLRISEASLFLLYDAGCVSQLRQNYRQEVAREVVSDDPLLSKASVGEVSVSDPALRRALEKRFRIETGPEGARYIYLPEPEANPARDTYLRAEVDGNGNVSLTSHLASEKGLYHTRIILYTGKDSLFSSRIPTLDPRNQRGYFEGWMVEEIHFTDRQDAELVQAIARHSGGPLRVRFTAGGSFYREILLPTAFCEQIRDAWLLSQSLKK
ncbi:MAG: hypothetical protein EAZ89_16795 [Bacteroidetes bacterium]|nr:MAG: hypothetical protein EAZ89_16795 [Bacteroidota bacterium]